jgi:hypothetical protein
MMASRIRYARSEAMDRNRRIIEIGDAADEACGEVFVEAIANGSDQSRT